MQKAATKEDTLLGARLRAAVVGAAQPRLGVQDRRACVPTSGKVAGITLSTTTNVWISVDGYQSVISSKPRKGYRKTGPAQFIAKDLTVEVLLVDVLGTRR
jgi:hypothetical protein